MERITRLYLFILLLLSYHYSNGQQLIFDTLKTDEGINKSIIWLTSTYGSGFGHKIYNYDPGIKTDLRIAARHNTSTWTDVVTITSDAKVAIGSINNPAAKLHVDGLQGGLLGKFTQSNVAPTDAYLNIGNLTNSVGYFIPNIVGRSLSPGRPFGIYITGEAPDTTPTSVDVNLAAVVLDGRNKTGAVLANNNVLAVNSYGQNLLMVKANGSVGIGTQDTKGYKLAVNGNAIFTRVKVEAYSGWPDYVFEKDYQLPALMDIEKYILEHKHLPDVPSAAIVEKEGQDLGEMNKILMRKVEELTLYLIAQDKRIKDLEQALKK
ncbi:hypothetical protein [Chitinophaga rupis]|nr:hypothetical protein [Chitinophaga rupis]